MLKFYDSRHLESEESLDDQKRLEMKKVLFSSLALSMYIVVGKKI